MRRITIVIEEHHHGILKGPDDLSMSMIIVMVLKFLVNIRKRTDGVVTGFCYRL